MGSGSTFKSGVKHGGKIKQIGSEVLSEEPGPFVFFPGETQRLQKEKAETTWKRTYLNLPIVQICSETVGRKKGDRKSRGGRLFEMREVESGVCFRKEEAKGMRKRKIRVKSVQISLSVTVAFYAVGLSLQAGRV